LVVVVSSFQNIGAASNAHKNELNFSVAPQLQDEGVSPHRSDLNDHSQSSLKNVGLKKTDICDVHAHDLTGGLIRDYVRSLINQRIVFNAAIYLFVHTILAFIWRVHLASSQATWRFEKYA